MNREEKQMDYQRIVDAIALPCCVLSVERKAEGVCGDIRIVCANRAFQEAVGAEHCDNVAYDALCPRDSRLESYCYQAAVLRRPVHVYTQAGANRRWKDQTLLPVEPPEGDLLHYCQFVFEAERFAEANRMASVSVDVAQAVIEASVMLMAADDVNSGVDNALQVLVEAAGADAACVALIDHEHRRVVNFSEVVSRNWHSVLERSPIPYEIIQRWDKVVSPCNSIVMKDARDYAWLRQTDPALYRFLRERGVNSLMLVPLQSDRTVIGHLTIINFAVEKLVETSEIVELVSFFIGTELCNQLLLEKLDILSRVDVLTGIHNRRAMQETVRALDRCAGSVPYGVINIDLNGLKVVNDEMGHEAGDRLLKQAAELLLQTFCIDDLFRTGGDEFVVIKRDISSEAFEAQVAALRRSVDAQSDVSFAMGHFWSNGQVDTTSALRIADERMYLDKSRFYEAHPELKRK